jgi:hypothetical protein
MANNILLGADLSEKLSKLSGQLGELKKKLVVLKEQLNQLEKNFSRGPVNCNPKSLSPMFLILRSQWSFFGKKVYPDYIFGKSVAFPSFGVYGKKGYPWRSNDAVIEMRENSLNQCPQELINALAARLGCSPTVSELLGAMANKNIKPFFFTVVSGLGQTQEDDQTLNMLYHSFLANNFYPVISDPTSIFCENVYMGLFGVDGVTPQDVPINKLSPIQVHFHDYHFSPNNARLTLLAGRKISIFWSVGIPEKNPKYVAVTFNLLVNDKDFESELFRKSDFYEETSFSKWLAIFENQAEKLDPLDKAAIKNFVAMMKKL